MKIALFTDGIYPFVVGGIQRHSHYLLKHLIENKIENLKILNNLDLRINDFILVAIHRPSNVYSKNGSIKLKELFASLSKKYKLDFPIQPRTVLNMKKRGKFEVFV